MRFGKVLAHLGIEATVNGEPNAASQEIVFAPALKYAAKLPLLVATWLDIGALRIFGWPHSNGG